MDAKEKILFLQRENRKRRFINDYIKGLSEALNQSIASENVLSLKESDVIQKKLFAIEREKEVIQIPKNESGKIERLILGIIKLFSNGNKLLKTYNSDDIGFVKVDSPDILLRWKEIIEFDKDDFILIDNNLKDGIHIELTEDYLLKDGNEEKIWLYEITLFGKLIRNYKKGEN